MTPSERPPVSLPFIEPAALPPAILAQVGSGMIVNGVVFAVLAGAVIFAVCRSSSRN